MKSLYLPLLLTAATCFGQTITTQPAHQLATVGQPATFSVTATAAGPITYQWRKNGIPILAATRATFTVQSAQLRDIGGYSVVVSSGGRQATSAEAELRFPGTLWGAGTDAFGQIGDGQIKVRPTPALVLTSVREVLAGSDSSLYVTTAGDLYAAGLNTSGRFGIGYDSPQPQPVKVATSFWQAALGSYHLVYITMGGEVWAAGTNGGRYGNGTANDAMIPIRVATGGRKVAAGLGTTLLLKADGSLWSTGVGPDGELGLGATAQTLVFTQVTTGVRDVAAGRQHNLFLRSDNSLWAMGSNTYGQLGDGTTVSRSVPIQVATNVRAIAAGPDYTLFQKIDGSLWGMGRNHYGQLADRTQINRWVPQLVAASVSSFCAGDGFAFFVDGAGDLYGWGDNSSGQLGDGTFNSRPTPVRIASQVTSVSAGVSHALFVKQDKTVYSMGNLGYGELLNRRTQNHGSPLLIAENVQQAVVGNAHLHYLTTEGRLLSSGLNSSGQGGIGSIGGLILSGAQAATDVASVSTLADHTLFIRRDGSLWGFGLNSSGQLGDGTTTNRPGPNQIAPQALACSAGGGHSLFIRPDGRLFGMGDNTYGQLGDRTNTTRPYLVEIATDVRFAAAGPSTSYFITNDGTLWGMGRNTDGQLGDGTRISRNVPVRIAPNVQTCSAGGSNAVYITTDGTVWGMGNSTNGRLGVPGLATYVTTPVRLAADMVQAVSGNEHLNLIGAAGNLLTSGGNSEGQLANGTFLDSAPPMTVATGVSATATRDRLSVFIQTAVPGTGSSPVIQAGPVASEAQPNEVLQLSVTATGTGPLDYQWFKNGVPIPGARERVLNIAGAQPSDDGLYSVQVRSSFGLVRTATVAVGNVVNSRLSNLSVRTVLAANQNLVVGAVVGEGSKNVLIRAAGPALNKFGLTGLADPRLEFYTVGAQPAATNDDWPANLGAVATSVGAFAFDAGSRDAALLQPASGPFTVQAKGAGPGAILVEVYDATGGNSPRLINLSARNQVGTGDDILIAGFSLTGTGTKQLLIRAVGPSLAAFGVQGVLADPRLTLLNARGAAVATNDNWDASLANVFSSVGAFPLTARSLDAALVVTLNAGETYTVQVAGANNGTGEALIEVYEVP